MVRRYHVWVGTFRNSEPAYFDEPDTGRIFLPSQFMRDIGLTWTDNPKARRYGPPHEGGRFWSPRMLPSKLHVREMATETATYMKPTRSLGRASKYLEWGRLRRHLCFTDAPQRVNTVVLVAHGRMRPTRARAGLKYLGAFPVRKRS